MVLWNWVANTPQKFGGTDGNEVYKQLEKHVRTRIAAVTGEPLRRCRTIDILGNPGEIGGSNT